MILAFIFILLLGPSLSLAQNLPNGFTCEDLLNAYRRKPQPKDQYEAALLAYDTDLCRRLGRKEITVAEFNVLQAAKLSELTEAKRKAPAQPKRDAIDQQLEVLNQQRRQEAAAAERAQREAAQQAEIVRRQQQAIQAQREAAARLQAHQQQQGPLNAHDLARYCASHGLGVDYNTNSCIPTGGFSRGGGGVAQSDTGSRLTPLQEEMIRRCGQLGRVPDWASGDCR